jgi:hypothetical protein
MKRILQYLNNPFPIESDWKARFKTAFFFALFVFAFLSIFQPFGLSTYKGQVYFHTAGYGLITLIGYVFTSIIATFIFPSFFEYDSWKVWKEILSNLCTIVVIGSLNVLYTVFIFDLTFSIRLFYIFLGYTLSVGILPISIIVLIREMRLRTTFEKNSANLNASFHPEKQKQAIQTTIETLQLENETVDIQRILFFQSSANYLEVVYLESANLKRKVIRQTLKEVESKLENQSSFVRCHKSFIVNLTHVERFSGNAQGYKLHFAQHEQAIPVSRQHNENVKTWVERK